MGNLTSRHRRQELEAQASSPGQPAIPQSSHYAQYPPVPTRPAPPQPAPIAPLGTYPPYYGPPPVSNGQYYGGWYEGQHAVHGSHGPPPQRPSGSYTPGSYPSPQGQASSGQRHRQSHSSGPRQQTSRPAPPTQELTQTATIRNAVNLKKQTLKVKQMENDANKLLISFTFDASSPCLVSTFVLAEEEVSNASKLNCTAQPAGRALKYDRGLGLTFPPSEGEAMSDASLPHRHVVDLSQCGAEPAESLAAPTGDVYPLVIRLETITEKGKKGGHTLEELTPGEAQKPWVQSQTTFAAIVRERDQDSGSTTWSARVLKQKIWVEGVSYELQEIYGLEQAAGRLGDADDSEERLCVICLSSPRDTTVLPCRHLCLCHTCAQEWRRQSSKCPICRMNVESLLRIRIKQRSSRREGD